MCLLAVLFRVRRDEPLVVAANRDEFLERPASPVQVLRAGPPRVLGGRDEVAGGTWLAVNEHGLVAGLTNKPSPLGPDRSKRSRGELPLLLAGHRSAREAAMTFAAEVHSADYNPCWLLVGDRDVLFSIDLTLPGRPAISELGPGIHVLENRPLASASPKAAWVRARLAGAASWPRTQLSETLAAVLASHELPPDLDGRSDSWRPPATESACVHAGPYGTRSATIVTVPAIAAAPRVEHASGAPCSVPFVDVSGLWSQGA